jgi:hypothetical protein
MIGVRRLWPLWVKPQYKPISDLASHSAKIESLTLGDALVQTVGNLVATINK